MLTLKQIRDDLKDIRYYYSRKEAFEQGFRVVGSNDIVGKAKRYNTVMQSAPPDCTISTSVYTRVISCRKLCRLSCATRPSISRYSISGCCCTCRKRFRGSGYDDSRDTQRFTGDSLLLFQTKGVRQSSGDGRNKQSC